MQPHAEPEVNVSTVEHISPFRFPGGKTALVPLVRRWLAAQRRPLPLFEPFCGGASVGLAAAFERLADPVVLIEQDPGIAAVWHTLLARGGATWLARRVLSFDLTPKTLREVLSQAPRTRRDLAFQTLVRNRTSHGGKLAPGSTSVRRGEGGRGIWQRWYPKTLARRMLVIGALRERLHFFEGDGLRALAELDKRPAAWFVDPPYGAAGRRLYLHHRVDHTEVITRAARLPQVLLTYQDCPHIERLARRAGFKIRRVALRTTHNLVKTELLLSHDFSWL